MLESKLQYSTGLKYSIDFNFNEEAFVKELKSVLGTHYSDFVKDKLVNSINNCLEFSQPKVQSKWTTMMKVSSASENKWKKKIEVVKPVAPRIMKERVL